MKEDKHTDRIIRQKLASYSAKPEHLTFRKVHEQYLRRKKKGYRAAFITTAVVLLSVAGLTIAGFFLFPAGKNEVSVNKEIRTASTEANSSSTVPEEQLSSEKTTRTTKAAQKQAEHPETGDSNSLQEKTNSAAETENRTLLQHAENSQNITKVKKKPDHLTGKISISKANEIDKSAQVEEGSTVADIKSTKRKKENVQTKQDLEKSNTSTGAAISFSRKKEKKVQEEPIALSDKLFHASPDDEANATKGKDTKKNPGDINQPADKDTQLSAKQERSEKSAGSPASTETDGSSRTTMKEEPATMEEMATEEIKANDTLNFSTQRPDSLIKNTATATSAENVAAPSPNPAKKHYFVVSPEVSWNSFAFKTSANPLAGADSASDIHKTNTQHTRSFSGGLHIGYKYKNVGISTGLQFYSSESEVNTNGSVRNQFVTSKQVKVISSVATTVIVTSTVIPPPISDSLAAPKVIISSVVYTATVRRTDTSYTNGTRSYVIVNGDTVNPRTYLNQVRFFSVPLYVNYSFNVWRNKLMIEPQAGVQLGIPIKSYQLVRDENRQFSYMRSKYPLKNYFFLLDASVKVNYRLSRKLVVYLKQGYFMSTKSVYATGYPIKNTFNNLYSSAGLSFLIE